VSDFRFWVAILAICLLILRGTRHIVLTFFAVSSKERHKELRSLNDHPVCSVYTGYPAVECKSKVKLSLCLTKHHAMKTYGREWRYSSTHS
jgi:hypothetical protein